MLRTVSFALTLLIYVAPLAQAQSDAPEGRPNAAERGTTATAGVGRSMDPGATALPTAPPPATSQNRNPAPPAAAFIAEPLPVIPLKEGESGHTRIVHRLANIPARTAAETLTKLLRTEGQSVSESVKDRVVIVPEVTVNCLLISGPRAAVEEVRGFLSEIDKPPSIVRLEVQLIQEKEPIMQAELSTLDNQLAYIQFGRQEARITGASLNNSSTYNTTTNEHVGSTIQIQPRVTSVGRVVAQLNIQDSRLGPQEEGTVVVTPRDGQPIRTPNTENITYQATMQLDDGQTQIVGASTRDGKRRQIAVTAHIIRPGTANAPEQN